MFTHHRRGPRSRAAVAIAVAATTLLAACGSAGNDSSGKAFSNKRVGVLVCCAQPQIDVIANTIVESVTTNDTGLKATVVNGRASTPKALTDAQTFLAQGYSAIWTTLITGQGFDSLAAQAKTKKVPWVNFSGSAVTGATLNIVIPEKQLGFAVGAATADRMIATGLSKAPIGATFDDTGANAARTDGFVDGVHSKLPSAKVYKVGNSKATTTAGATIGANLLQAHPDIRVLFGWTADDGIGLQQAAKEAGHEDPEKFIVATDEGNEQVYSLVGGGSVLQIGASLGYPFGAIAGERLLEKALKGQSIPPTAIMRPTLVTPDNVELVNKQEADPFAYPERIDGQLAFSDEALTFGDLPTQQVDPVVP